MILKIVSDYLLKQYLPIESYNWDVFFFDLRAELLKIR
jgi:hypothetical protein